MSYHDDLIIILNTFENAWTFYYFSLIFKLMNAQSILQPCIIKKASYPLCVKAMGVIALKNSSEKYSKYCIV